MNKDIVISLAVAALSAGLVYGIFYFPSLTDGGTKGATGVSQAEFDKTVSAELAYCQNHADDVNCQCFANISGAILANKEPQVRGVRYANKEELARAQAGSSC